MTSHSIDPSLGSVLPGVQKEEEEDDDEDDERISSAAACLRFSIRTNPYHDTHDDKDDDDESDNDVFHPVFTHQIFPNEYIPNYRPIVQQLPSRASLLEQTQPRPQQHPSFQYPSQYGLLIHISLTPSCASCYVDITVQILPNDISLPITNDMASSNDNKTEHVELPTPNETTTSTTTLVIPNDSSKKRKMDPMNENIQTNNISESIQRILWTQLQPFLPPILKCTTRIIPSTSASVHESAYIHIDGLPPLVSPPPSSTSISPLSSPDLEQPYGTILHEYTHQSTSKTTRTTNFCITLCRGSDCTDYFENALQRLAYYYIENASHVKVNDPSWKVLYVFRKHTTASTATSTTTTTTTTTYYSFVGYMTLYYFENPFRKPTAGTIVRICQVWILPPYQRQQHGQHMLHALYQHYDRDSNIVEINVEDPVPAFTYLRLLVDYERYQTHCPEGFQTTTAAVTIHDEAFFKGWNNVKMLLPFQTILKTTMVQIQMIYEIEKLRHLQIYNQEHCHDDNRMMELFTKRYRLMVKQRLYEQNKESLDERNKKQQLDVMYRKLQQQYEHILSKTLKPKQ